MALKYVDPNTGNLIEIRIKAAESLPLGTILEYSGGTAPKGYMICDGSAISRTKYSELFNLIGTTYGNGDGSTTFNLPDLQGKIPVGKDENDTDFDTLGNTGGEKKHQLTVNEIPAHSHVTEDYFEGSGGTSGVWAVRCLSNLEGYKHVVSNTGGNQPHNNLQPYITLNYIIKVEEIIPVAGRVINQEDSTNETSTYSCKYLDENFGKGGSGSDLTPIGTISLFGGGVIPDGWLKCDGEVYAIDDYPELYSVIGLTWVNSSSHGASTGYFCVPDLGGRVAIGATDELSALNYAKDYSLGNFGGSEKHTHTIRIGHATWYSLPLSESSYGLYIMNENGARSTTTYEGSRVPVDTRRRNAALTTSHTSFSHDGFATETQGSSFSEFTLQPYLVTNYIIKAKHPQEPDHGVLSETLPIGTEVDFTGSTIPDGWQVVDDPNAYSSIETCIGTWDDNGTEIPLYRKIVTFPVLPNNTTSSTNHNVSNLKEFTLIEGFARSNQNKGGIPLPHATSSPVTYWVDDTKVYVMSTSDRTAYTKAYIYLYYTKTTN